MVCPECQAFYKDLIFGVSTEASFYFEWLCLWNGEFDRKFYFLRCFPEGWHFINKNARHATWNQTETNRISAYTDLKINPHENAWKIYITLVPLESQVGWPLVWYASFFWFCIIGSIGWTSDFLELDCLDVIFYMVHLQGRHISEFSRGA